MVVIELSYKSSLDQVNMHLDAHRAFLGRYYDQGLFIASGPKIPRDGGVILAVCDAKQAKEIIAEDPFYKNGIAEYRMMEFDPIKHSDGFAQCM